MNLSSLEDLPEAQGDGPLGNSFNATIEEHRVLLPGRRGQLHLMAVLIRRTGRLVETHMTIAAEPQKLQPDASATVELLAVTPRSSRAVSGGAVGKMHR